VFDSLLDLLAAETNVRRIEVVASDADLVRLRGKANFRTLGKRHGAEVKAVAAWVGTLPAEALRQLERGEPFEERYRLEPEDVTVVRDVVTSWPVATDGPFVAALDPELTPELATAGLARELVNRIQRLRKDAGYEVTTRIAVSIECEGDLLEAADREREWIAGETLAREFVVGMRLQEPDRIETIRIDDHAATLAVRRLGDGRTTSGPAQADGP
jgi:isoleucyl-tRNA synthetase